MKMQSCASLNPMNDRTYPPPTTPPLMYQSWHDLLFMHWPLNAETLRAHIPPGLELDTFEHQAWIAVVPFRMADIYPRGLFPVPYLSAFAELNVRTYVIKDGKPGVWFFSLDAANPIAVAIARRFFKLPYFHARMQCLDNHGHIAYSSYRSHHGAPYLEFAAAYHPTGTAFVARPGSLEYFLTARYCLYTHDTAGKLYCGDIDHEPWPLQTASAEISLNTMTSPWNISLQGAPLLHFSKTITVKIWGLKRL